MELRKWWRPALAVLSIALVSCSEEPTAASHGADAPQWSQTPDLPDLGSVAKFRQNQRPPNQQVRQLIGPEGGSVSLNGFEIVVPAGAVDRPTLFSLRIPSFPDGAARVIGEFAPHQDFKVAVTIRIPQAGTDAEDGAHIAWWSGTAWVPLPTRLLEDGRIETQVWHFSYYAARKGIILTGG